LDQNVPLSTKIGLEEFGLRGAIITNGDLLHAVKMPFQREIFLSMSRTLSNYHRTLRNNMDEKKDSIERQNTTIRMRWYDVDEHTPPPYKMIPVYSSITDHYLFAQWSPQVGWLDGDMDRLKAITHFLDIDIPMPFPGNGTALDRKLGKRLKLTMPGGYGDDDDGAEIK
jgi:hypothetical protein